MKKITLFLAILSLGWVAFAQQDGSTLEQPVRPPVERPWAQEEVGEFSDPIPYVHVRGEGNIHYSITVWRKIDLRERMNHPLYFPTEQRGTWRSLARVIFDAVDISNPDNENTLPIYRDEFCQEPFPRNQLSENMYYTTTMPNIDPVTLETIGVIEIPNYFNETHILSYNVKEIWFFDNKRSLQEVRILQIAPMIEYERPTSGDQYQEENQNEEGAVDVPKQQRRFGYIYYDELRPYLAKQEVYNPKNFSQRISLDDLLTWRRMFSSYIYAETNTYSDMYISDYLTNARDQMIEAERITNKIREKEHDVWEF